MLQAGLVSATALPPANKQRTDGFTAAADQTKQPSMPPGNAASPATPAVGAAGKLSFSLGGVSGLQVSRPETYAYGQLSRCSS